jgi:hypothetical protein
MVRFVLTDVRIEDPGSYIFGPGCDGIFMILIDTQIHFVGLVVVSEFALCNK